MPAASYHTSPQPSSRMPAGIPYIVGNEAAERFSFYGMKAILAVYMTKHLLDWSGQPAPMSDEATKTAIHLFVGSAYFFPILGALLSDWLLGKYRTILWLSIVYCLGHLFLAVVPAKEGLLGGLFLIAVGAGGIKPCVSAHVGDQFGEQNQHLLGRVFGWFYFSINLGAMVSTLLTPLLLDWYGAHVAFGVPGVLMALATLIFWLGRHKFVHIPAGGVEFLRETFNPEGLRSILKLIPLYLHVAIFWSLYDQTGSAWVLQAEKMDRRWLGHEWNASQIQAANPLLILLMIPLFSYVGYPLLDRVCRGLGLGPLTALRKVAVGFILMVGAFAISGSIESRLEPQDAAVATALSADPALHRDEVIEQQIAAGERVNIGWQLFAYVVLTASEVMVSITCLEFSYTQAPNPMKSVIMALYLLSVSAGNFLTSGINWFIQNPDGSTKLPGDSYYWFFTALMALASVTFLIVLATYKEQTHLQQSEPAAAPS